MSVKKSSRLQVIKNNSAFAGITEDLGIIGVHREHLPQFDHFMTFVTQHPSSFDWHVMIKKKLHIPELICRATKASISARWSS